MKKYLKILGRVLLLAAISLFLGSRLYSWNAKTLAGNTMPMPFGIGMSVVLSGSMEPNLSVDDLVIVHEQDSYEIGDIVVYQSGDMLIIHRIVTQEDGIVTTRGDANDVEDEPIAASLIKGKAVAHVPGVGAVVRFLKTAVGTILLMVLALVFFELPYLQKRKKDEADLERLKEEIRRLKDQ